MTEHVYWIKEQINFSARSTFCRLCWEFDSRPFATNRYNQNWKRIQHLRSLCFFSAFSHPTHTHDSIRLSHSDKKNLPIAISSAFSWQICECCAHAKTPRAIYWEGKGFGRIQYREDFNCGLPTGGGELTFTTANMLHPGCQITEVSVCPSVVLGRTAFSGVAQSPWHRLFCQFLVMVTDGTTPAPNPTRAQMAARPRR